jgi:hypothetical protein
VTLVEMVSVSVVVVPDAVLSCSHVALSLTVHDRVLPPVLVILNVFAVGFVPPTVPAKAKLAGLKLIVPLLGDPATVRVRGIVLGVAPGAVTVIVAV